MELNNYQRQVMRDLSAYMNCVNESDTLPSAWRKYWFDKDIAVGLGGVPSYNNSIERVPHVCMKVPTGGGKTFMACTSVKRIFDALPMGKPQMVVWLYASTVILSVLQVVAVWLVSGVGLSYVMTPDMWLILIEGALMTWANQVYYRKRAAMFVN